MAYDGARQRLVLFSGQGSVDEEWRYLGDTWEWNGVERTQTADVGPTPRYGCAMTYDPVR
jgi:hypothetical protein